MQSCLAISTITYEWRVCGRVYGLLGWMDGWMDGRVMCFCCRLFLVDCGEAQKLRRVVNHSGPDRKVERTERERRRSRQCFFCEKRGRSVDCLALTLTVISLPWFTIHNSLAHEQNTGQLMAKAKKKSTIVHCMVDKHLPRSCVI